MVGLSCYGIFWIFLVTVEHNIKIVATNFTIISVALLQSSCWNCYVHFRLFCLLQKCLPLYEKKKFLVNFVEPKLQETVLYGRKRDVQLVPHIARSFPIFQRYPRLIWITMLPENTVFQDFR